MRTIKCVAVVGLALLLAGCAIHPLPEDVTRETTFLIVQKIRCEARDALKNISLRVLRESDSAALRALLLRVEQGELRITDLFERPEYNRLVPPNIKDRFIGFYLSAVAMDFTFDITETNTNSADANFRNPFNLGVFTLGVAAGNTLSRQNDRQFKVADTFLELYEKLQPEYCAAIAAGGGNFIYPITGKIGMEEVFDTYIRLNDVSSEPNSPGDIKSFTDKLSFTTTFDVSAAPKIELSPIADQRFRLANASATLKAQRKDAHKVTIAVTTGPRLLSLTEARKFSGIATRRSATVAKRSALRALEDRRTDDFFATQRNIIRRLEELAP